MSNVRSRIEYVVLQYMTELLFNIINALYTTIKTYSLNVTRQKEFLIVFYNHFLYLRKENILF